jgi:hypothetical protein
MATHAWAQLVGNAPWSWIGAQYSRQSTCDATEVDGGFNRASKLSTATCPIT